MMAPRQPSVSPQLSIRRQSGVVLVTSLLLLIVVTILAISMFRSFGLDEKIAGNVREKQRALNAAETAEQYAEYWLASSGGTSAVVCTNPPVSYTVGQGCTLPLASFTTTLPWTVGVNYTPTAPTASNSTPTLMNVTTTPGQGTYYYTPMFYITYLGATGTGNGKIYQIDAAGYGGSPDTAAVVESTYLVQSSVSCLGCNQ